MFTWPSARRSCWARATACRRSCATAASLEDVTPQILEVPPLYGGTLISLGNQTNLEYSNVQGGRPRSGGKAAAAAAPRRPVGRHARKTPQDKCQDP